MSSCHAGLNSGGIRGLRISDVAAFRLFGLRQDSASTSRHKHVQRFPRIDVGNVKLNHNLMSVSLGLID